MTARVPTLNIKPLTLDSIRSHNQPLDTAASCCSTIQRELLAAPVSTLDRLSIAQKSIRSLNTAASCSSTMQRSKKLAAPAPLPPLDARNSIRSLMSHCHHSTARLTTPLNQLHQTSKPHRLRTSRSEGCFAGVTYASGSLGHTLKTSLPPSGSVLIAHHRKNDLLAELGRTNERMKEIMEHRRAALEITLKKTNRMLHKKLIHQRDDFWNCSKNERNKARNAIKNIENQYAKKGSNRENMVPYKTTNQWGQRTNQDSSGCCIGMGLGQEDYTSTGVSIYNSLTQFNGVTDMRRSRLKAVDRRQVLRNPIQSSEFKHFLEKAIELGIDLGSTGHT